MSLADLRLFFLPSLRTFQQEFADSLNIPFLETSAKDSTNVEEMFYTMTRLIQQQCVALILLMNQIDQVCSAEKHGMHAGDKAGVPSGATLSRESPEKEDSGGCC